VPPVGQARLDRNALATRRQDVIAVGLVLGLEALGARHRHHARADAVSAERLDRADGELDLGAGRDQRHIGRTIGGLAQDVAAARDLTELVLVAVLVRHALARIGHGHGTVGLLQCAAPGGDGLDPVAGAPELHARNHAQARQVLDRLVSGPVLAQPDRVVGIDVDARRMHERGHAHRIARVVGEGQERPAERLEAAV